MSDPINDVYDFIFNLDKRLVYLEKDIPFIERRVDNLKFYEENLYLKLSSDVMELKNSFNDINESLRKLVTYLSLLSLNSKGLIKKEHFELIKQKIDEIPINEYLTKKEIRN